MGKLRLCIESTSVLGVSSIVDLKFNDTVLADNLQVSNNPVNLEYTVDLTQSEYNLTVDLLNPQAFDSNNDGNFLGDNDQTMKTIITRIEILKSENYKIILPQQGVIHTVPEGYVETGLEIPLIPEILEFVSFGENYSIKFNDEKILSISGTDLTYYTVIGDQLFDGDTLIAEATPL